MAQRIKKFRAYNPHGIAIQYKTLQEFQREGFGLPLDDPETRIMQFTGLLDRNGKEIYEGDIIQLNTPRKVKVFVDYFPEYGRFVLRNYKEEEPMQVMQSFVLDIVKSANHIDDEDEEAMDTVEVIGNIHENPDLLK